MSTNEVFESFQRRKIKTVGELRKRLADLPDDTILVTESADIGGYDVSQHNFGEICYDPKAKTVTIGHFEHEVSEAFDKKLITFEQYKELIEETD